jgi:general secretion pathway protein B
MSFILDALKKSENDRQRQSGPALFEVRVAPPRSKLPLLAIVIVSLLVVNLGVVGWIMLRKPAAAAVPTAAPTGAVPPVAGAPPIPAAPQPAYAAQPNSQAPTPQGYPPQYAQQGQYPQGQNPPPLYAQGGGQQAPPSAYNAPNNGYAPNGTNNSYPQQQGGNSYAPPANQPGGYGRTEPSEPRLADRSSQEELNPDDYAPARDAPPPGIGAGRVTRGTASGLPTYAEAAAETSLPPLHLDLHSYAADPTKRFVLINMKRLYEGQSLPEGPKVESITTDSAIMSYNGKRFVLDKD